jgi:DNA-binding beta-propeller fold protein YncE
MLLPVLRVTLVSVCLVAAVDAADVVTIGGNGKPEYSGDGGAATAAGIGQPFGLVTGPDGALYVCEVQNHTVRRIDLKSSVVTTVVGSGKKGNGGDGGQATQALCNEPYEVRFDAAGHLYEVEMQNHVVRRVDAKSGKITTVAGNGKPGFGGDGGPATQAQLRQPHSIALDDAGHLYIADIGNHRVRRVDLATGVITTFGGTGEKKPTPDGAGLAGTPLNGPRALDFEKSSNSLILALREGNAVYRIDLTKSTLHHLAGTGKSGYAGDGGPARSALLSGPKGVALAPNGDIFLADTESHTVRVIRRKSGIIETIVGDGKKGDGPDGDPHKCRMDRPHGVFVDAAGNLFIGDSNNHRVRTLPAK